MMVYLRNLEYKDIEILQQKIYGNKTINEIKIMIDEMNTKIYNNRFFEMFGVFDDYNMVGMISLQEHSKSVISCGPEIFEEYRRKGYGYGAMNRALELGKEKGYRIASAQIRTDNKASISLHNKVGFETDYYEYVNGRGNKIYLYIKAL